MGTYLGVRRGGRLVAMAGERLHPPGWTEISAVCTDAEHRGEGLATRLVLAVAAGIRERGDTPFLHASAANVDAIRLYAALGFRLRRTLRFGAVRTPAGRGSDTPSVARPAAVRGPLVVASIERMPPAHPAPPGPQRPMSIGRLDLRRGPGPMMWARGGRARATDRREGAGEAHDTGRGRCAAIGLAAAGCARPEPRRRAAVVVTTPGAARPDERLPAPAGEPVLTITGRVERTNVEHASGWTRTAWTRSAAHPDRAVRAVGQAADELPGRVARRRPRRRGRRRRGRRPAPHRAGQLPGRPPDRRRPRGRGAARDPHGDGGAIPIAEGGPIRIVFADGVASGANANQWIWSVTTIDVR
jgi:hypothetical protein